MKYITYILILLFTQVSCSGFKEAGKVLRNEKTNTTDEFLVKKEPLIMPPDLDKIPEPQSIKDKKKMMKKKLKRF